MLIVCSYYLASLTKWVNVRLQTKWLWVRVPLHSLKYLLLVVCFSLHQKNIVYKYKVQRKPIVKEMQIDIYFHLSLIFMLKNAVFLFRVKIPY